MARKNAILIIDPQNDFCNPGDVNGKGLGSLYVPGAEDDMQRLADWISQNEDEINHITVTLDSHQVNDIAHPSFWADKDGNFAPPFTPISLAEVNDGTWTPRFSPKTCIAYLEALEAQGEFGHFIWPEHCIIGTEGAAIYKPVSDAISSWCKKNWAYQPLTKGTYQYSEHYGAFQAQIPSSNRPETQFNQDVVNVLEKFQNVYLAGEAESHCVSNTLKQILDEAPQLASKLIVLEDCMSVVPGFEHIADDIYDRARKEGVRFSTTAQENLVGSQVATA